MKLIALDLDGTLLNRDGTISDETIAHMTRLVQQGCFIAIATGRPYKATIQLLSQNGLHPGKTFPHWLICNERELYSLEGDAYKPELPWNDDIYEKERSYLSLSRRVIDEVSVEHECEFLVNNPFMQQDRGFVEIFFWTREEAEKVLPLFADKLAQHPIEPIRNNRLIAFRLKGTGKGIMLDKLAKRLHIEADEILAVGDSHNDLSMLKRFSAATTQNADPDIKETVRQRKGIVATASHSLGVAEILARL